MINSLIFALALLLGTCNALAQNVKFGPYRPNGVPTGSLGVFEHWNNANDRQYSRNLGRNAGIELYEVR